MPVIYCYFPTLLRSRNVCQIYYIESFSVDFAVVVDCDKSV